MVALGGAWPQSMKRYCLGRPAFCGMYRHGARYVIAERFSGTTVRRNLSVVRCYAALWWLGACMPRCVACRLHQMASPVRNGVS